MSRSNFSVQAEAGFRDLPQAWFACFSLSYAELATKEYRDRQIVENNCGKVNVWIPL
jgi:hypothetical protein